MTTDAAALAHLPLFAGLPDEHIARIAGIVRRRTVPAHTSIMTVEQPGEAVYVILRGTVKIHVEQPSGADVILAILGPNATVGEMSPVDRVSRSATVVTLEETTVLWMTRVSFQQCLRAMPGLSLNLVRILSQRLRMANAQIQALAALDVPGRVARQIVAFAEEYGRPADGGGTLIPLRLTQSDLADMVGASRVRVNHALVEYKQSGYVSTTVQRHMVVHDLGALAERAG